MYCYVRNGLPRIRLVSLVRLCYVFLLPCYLGDTVFYSTLFAKKNVVCSVHKETPSKQP
jgi:ABC-type multidrug transport system permease subunit